MKMLRQLFLAGILAASSSTVLAGPPDVTWHEERGHLVAEILVVTDLKPEGAVEVTNYTGDIEASGHDGSSAKLVLQYTFRRGVTQELAQKTLKKIVPEIKSTSRLIRIDGPVRFGDSDKVIGEKLRMELPRDANISAEVSGGDIKAQDFKSALDLLTSGGDITLEQIDGDISVATSGGDISLKQITGEISGATSGGDIVLFDCTGELEAATSGGDIVADIIKSPELHLSTSGGDISVSNAKTDRLSLSTSGGDLDAREITVGIEGELATSGGDIATQMTKGSFNLVTGSGEIRVNQHLGDLEVTNGSGDIVLRQFAGSLEATVGSGSVLVEFSEANTDLIRRVDVSCGSGDIDMTLPKSLGAYIEATVSAKSGEIETDYRLEIERSRSGELRASGDVNGGGIPILLKGGVGTITVRKP